MQSRWQQEASGRAVKSNLLVLDFESRAYMPGYHFRQRLCSSMLSSVSSSRCRCTELDSPSAAVAAKRARNRSCWDLVRVLLVLSASALLLGRCWLYDTGHSDTSIRGRGLLDVNSRVRHGQKRLHLVHAKQLPCHAGPLVAPCACRKRHAPASAACRTSTDVNSSALTAHQVR